MISVAYSNSNGSLTILTADKEIQISGEGMDILEEQIYDNIRKTVRESKVAMFDPDTPVVVKTIRIQDRYTDE